MHTFKLHDGSIFGTGTAGGVDGTFAVLGGTGRYAGVQGTYADATAPGGAVETTTPIA